MCKGFSLIGFLLVVIIVMGLATLMLSQYAKSTKQAHHTQQKLLQDVRALQGTLDAQQREQQRQIDSLVGQ